MFHQQYNFLFYSSVLLTFQVSSSNINMSIPIFSSHISNFALIYKSIMKIRIRREKWFCHRLLLRNLFDCSTVVGDELAQVQNEDSGHLFVFRTASLKRNYVQTVCCSMPTLRSSHILAVTPSTSIADLEDQLRVSNFNFNRKNSYYSNREYSKDAARTRAHKLHFSNVATIWKIQLRSPYPDVNESSFWWRMSMIGFVYTHRH